MQLVQKYIFLILVLGLLLLSGCALLRGQTVDASAMERAPANACAVTEPVLLTPPQDDAVMNKPEAGYYFTNEDQSIIASAWWWKDGEGHRWQAGKEGNKVGWFRPEGAALEITGRRLDAQAPPLTAEAPCCHPTRFHSSGLYFPTGGCWEVTARAGGKMLTFTAWVDEPQPD